MDNLQYVNSLEDLLQLIKEDKKSISPLNNRFPVRFIFLNSFDELRILIKSLSDIDISTINISDFLTSDNGWLTPDELENNILKLSEDAIIFPISEYIRFLDDNLFSSTIRRLFEMEVPGKRFYVPLIGLYERAENIFNKKRKEWVPIWRLNAESRKIHIYQVNYDFNIENFNLKGYELITTTKEWLNIWKKENIENVLSLSKPLAIHYKNTLPDQTFNLDEISNPKEFMEKILGLDFSIIFSDDEIDFWNKIINEIGKFSSIKMTFKNFLSNYFNINNINDLTITDFLFYYYNSDLFDHWLIKNYIIISDEFQTSYSYKCFENLRKYTNEELSNELWMHIFHIDQNKILNEFFRERDSILRYINAKHNISPDESMLKVNLEGIKNLPLSKMLKYLTNITLTEKLFILNSIKNEDLNTILFDLKHIYPELYYYLDWDSIKLDVEAEDWIIDYLKCYNYSKVKNCKLPIINEILNDKNKDKSAFSQWYYSVQKPQIDDKCHNIWVDGMGAEWLPLLTHLISGYGKFLGKYLEKKVITRVNLPTTTKCNKYNYEKIEDLDQYIHKQKSYTHPISLIEEIEIIKKIVKKILNYFDDKICITSDHGLSFLCTKQFGNSKKLEFLDARHEGRYCWVEDSYSDKYYLDWDVEDGDCKHKKVLVAITHVSLNNTPAREVHGGATPEEILVPYIQINSIKEKIKYSINPTEFEITTSEPIIKFIIQPSPIQIPNALIDGENIKLSFNQHTEEYIIDLTGYKSGQYLLKILIGDDIFEIKTKIKGGFKEVDLLDF